MSNFEFLKQTHPDLFKLAYSAEHVIADDPFAAMSLLKQMTAEIISKLAGEAEIVTHHNYADGIIFSLWKNKIIGEDMYVLLREIELFDPRESEIVVDCSRVESLFYRVYDFTVWFYQTYVDGSYVPDGLYIANTATSQKNEPEPEVNKLNSIVHIDGTSHDVEWQMSLQDLSNYVIRDENNEEKYEGQIVRGLKHGQGVYIWRDGTVYRGYWNKDLEHGYGEKLFANGDIYRGYWKNGAFDGKGTYIWKDGHTYEGQWQDGFEHGFGTKTSANGDKNTGYWTYGEFVHTSDQLNEGT